MSHDFIKATAISPAHCLAGDSVEITISLTFGQSFDAQGAALVLDLPGMLGFSRPSIRSQEDGGYVAVLCSNPDITYRKRLWDCETNEFYDCNKPPTYVFSGQAARLFVLEFASGHIEDGDTIAFKWGYTRHGMSIGTRVTTIVPKPDCRQAIEVRFFRALARALPDRGHDYDGYTRPRPDERYELEFGVKPRECERVRIIKGLAQDAVLPLDRFSNLCEPSAWTRYVAPGPGCQVNASGAIVAPKGAGVSVTGLSASTTPDMAGVYEGCNIYFGDLHTHSSVSPDSAELERMIMGQEDCLLFGRDAAQLDFMAVTDHHEPWHDARNMIGRANWEHLLALAAQHTVEGRFLAFAGLEFRCARGDTVIVTHDDFAYDEIADGNLKSIRDWWARFAGRDYLSIPHFHNSGSLPAGEWYLCPDPRIEPNLEIYSCHGSFESTLRLERQVPDSYLKRLRDDRNARYLLGKGYRYGLTCNSDGHEGNPGVNGLTAVYAPELSKAAILDAIRRRRVYGTTNARIKLLFTVDGVLMGGEVPASDKASIAVAAEGEEPFKAVDIILNGAIVHRAKPYARQHSMTLSRPLSRGDYLYCRVIQMDNHMAWSSPIWAV